MKHMILTAAAAVLAVSAAAATRAQQPPTLTCDLGTAQMARQLQLCVNPVAHRSPQAVTTLIPIGKEKVAAEIPDFAPGIYNLYGQTSTWQTSLPVWLDREALAKPVKVTVGEDYSLATSLKGDANANLSEAARLFNALRRDIGVNMATKTDSVLLGDMKGFQRITDSLLSVRPCAPEVESYMRLWAYTTAADTYTLSRHLARRLDRSVPFGLGDFLPQPWDALDTPLAMSFPTAAGIVATMLPGKSVEEKLAVLVEKYDTPQVRAQAMETLLEDFVRRHDYKGDYDGGEMRLVAMTDTYGLDPKWLKSYRSHRATLEGLTFPTEGVKLVDADGNEVDFGRFKGKWVYVDMWASWCGPCCQQVPYLQKLEAELKAQGAPVEFVSISTDSQREPWLKKMKALDMHGHQLWDSTQALGSQLNIRAIPHFLIYDPQGKLYRYKTTRPSDPATLELLKSLKL